MFKCGSLLKPSLVVCGRRCCATFLERYAGVDGRIRSPKNFNFARDVVDRWAAMEVSGERVPRHPALWYVPRSGPEIRWSFCDISSQSKQVANVLAENGIRPKDRVLAIVPSMPEWWLIQLGTCRLGSTFTTVTTQLTPSDLLDRLTRLRASSVIANSEMADKVDAVADQCATIRTKLLVDPTASIERPGWINLNRIFPHASDSHQCFDTRSDDIFNIYFTSGTTNKPKMVAHTHSSLSLGLLNEYKYYYENTKDDLVWCFSDPGWVKAIYSYFYTTWLGGSGVFVYEMPRFNPEVTLSVLRKYPITLCSAVATCYRMMLEHEKKDQLNLSPTLRACNTGGESIDHHVIDDWEARTGIRIRIAYGQTEMLPISSQRKSVPYKAGTLGRPGLGVDVVILDENLAEVSRKEEGQIAVKIRPYRPLSLFQEYLEDPVKTAEVFKGDYYLTGDRGYMDEDGYLWFVGRNDDVINSAGYRIGPAEVEEALNSHPAVAESAVVSSPDVERGVVVKAFVVVRDGSQSGPELVRSLQDHVKSITAPYKYPRKVEFVESLPKTVSGKLQRALLRQKEWSNQNKHG